jgi:predicted esterase
MRYCILFVFCIIAVSGLSQQGSYIRFTTTHAMFPDTARKNGHTYNGKLYPAAAHYSDSSVLIYVPQDFSPGKTIDLVFWFHGWGNNIDTAVQQLQLIEQFAASKRNAVFVFPEGPKNAPDSYGGKLEQPVVFEALVKDVLQQLQKQKLISRKQNIGMDQCRITLAGHSGAYRVISRIINHAPVQELILFDALYGGNDFYLEWMKNPRHRFVHIYTKDGGTYDNSKWMVTKIRDSLAVPVIDINEDALSQKVLRHNKKLFIYSNKGHNEVITYRDYWRQFLGYFPRAIAY